MPVSPTQIALAASLLALAVFALAHVDRGVLRDHLRERFVAGVPLGTLATVAVVVAFYLFAQSGLRHPDSPVVYAFVSWSYFYPLGTLTAGIGHGGAGHIVSNMTGTLVLAPIVEYVWSHYPGGRTAFERRAGGGTQSGPSDDEIGPEIDPDLWPEPTTRLRDRPLVRALVVFPSVLFALALFTSAFALGPGIGFSGALYGIIGFAVVAKPLWAALGVLVTAGVSTLFAALTNPVVRDTLESGAPGPPSWAGVGFQAHLLGFLVGVLLAIGLLRARRRSPNPIHVAAAVFLVGLVQSVWLVAGGGGEEFVMYRGAGVTMLVWLTLAVAVAAGGSDRPFWASLVRADDEEAERRVEGIADALLTAWLAIVLIGAVATVAAAAAMEEAVVLTAILAGAVAIVLALPVVPTLLSRRGDRGPTTRRDAAVLALVAFTLLLSLPMAAYGLVVVDDPTIEGSEAVEVGDYTVAYVADEPAGQSLAVDDGGLDLFNATSDGVVVASDDREVWTVAERPSALEHDGNATVVVGGVGWRESVDAERIGWDVSGAGTAYAVDLTHDGDTVRSYVGDAERADVRLAGHEFAVVPDGGEFLVRAFEGDGEDPVGEVPVPATGETAALDGFDLRLIEDDERDENGTADRLVVERDDSTVVVATRE